MHFESIRNSRVCSMGREPPLYQTTSGTNQTNKPEQQAGKAILAWFPRDPSLPSDRRKIQKQREQNTVL